MRKRTKYSLLVKWCDDCGVPFTVRPQNYPRTIRCHECRMIYNQKWHANYYQNNKTYYREHEKKNKSSQRQYRKAWDSLSDKWVRNHIKRDQGIPLKDITKEMIDIKRTAMIAGRMVRKLWKKEATSGA